MSPVHAKTTLIMKVTKICFVSIKDGKFFHIFHSWKTKSHLYLYVHNITVIQSYSWYIPFYVNTI